MLIRPKINVIVSNFPQSLTVAGYYKNLARIGHYVDQVLAQANLDDRAAYAVHMAVDEACTNIIKHAYGGEGRGSINISYRIRPDGLQFTIYDHSDTDFDINHVPQLDTTAPLEKRQSGGMGVFFIHQLMDRVEYQSGTSRGNKLTLFKRRNPTL